MSEAPGQIDFGQPLKGDGRTDVGLYVNQRLVVMRFPRPTEWVGMEATNALGIAEEMARLAYHVLYGKKPTAAGGSTIKREILTKLKVRMTVIVKEMVDKHTKPQLVAERLLDIVLAEIERTTGEEINPR